MRKSNKQQEVPAVINSITAGVVRLNIDPLKPRAAQIDIQGVGVLAVASPDFPIALAADTVRLVKSPGFVQWAKQCGSTSSAAARRAAGAKKAWETKRKKMAAEARAKSKGKGAAKPKAVATKQKVTIPARAIQRDHGAGPIAAPTKKVIVVRSKLNPPAPKSAKLPLTGTAAL